ncbi:DUF3124 domain-containing protein [Christiangramia portivictoriae]|uniref:DUF3124 domain-containing protein n=1 Tax=Christiangramia portivictoriae TaxID=326069 RepID=UPI00041D0887|nr:DUF3124 domain-containing protein [Christiangramia portivictoriae]
MIRKIHTIKLLSGMVFLLLMLQSCEEQKQISSIDPVNWQSRQVKISQQDSLTSGETYLSIYSEIYSQTEHITHDLTATISMRNTSRRDTIYVEKAEYYATDGKLIRTYFDAPIYIAPLETIEIVIDETDRSGGTGANFIFDWKADLAATEPVFDAVMISTSGQQGLSFTTQGIRTK